MCALDPRRYNLTALCQHILNEYIAGTKLVVTLNAPPEPLEAEVDLERIGQVLLNLLSNATKYSPPGPPITITLESAGYKCIVAVHDHGLAIPADQLPQYFERLYPP